MRLAFLAVLLQLIAPVQAFSAVVALATDPLAGAVICGAHDPGAPQQAPADHACHVCPVCLLAGGALTAIWPEPAAVPPPRLRAVPVCWADDAVQARGPPVARPRARSPPFFS